MAGEAEAAEPKLPFDWRQIEDEDELSFGSELGSESEGNIDVDPSGPQSREQAVEVDVAAQSTAPAEQRYSARIKPEPATEDEDELKIIEPTRENSGRQSKLAASQASRQQNTSDATNQNRKPRKPVTWTAPPSKPNEVSKSFDSLGAGVRGMPQISRGNSASQQAAHRPPFDASARGPPQMRPSWAHRGHGGAYVPIVSGLRGRGVQHAPLPIERGQFMNKRLPQVQRPHGDEMGSILGQLKSGGVPKGVAQPATRMNHAARPFVPRPPSKPPQQPHRPPQQQRLLQQMQPAPPQQQPAYPREQAPGSVSYMVPRSNRPVAKASTWIRGISDRVGTVTRMAPDITDSFLHLPTETTTAPADSKPPPKSTISSTWVNPDVSAATAPRPSVAAAAAATTAAAAATAPAATESAPKPMADAAAAEALRQKDEMIAKLQAELSKQAAGKRRMEEEENEDASAAEPGPRKSMRTGGEGRVPRPASRLAPAADGRRAEVAPRQKVDIISRVQFNTRSREDRSSVKDKPHSPRVSRSPSPGHRSDYRKEHHSRDGSRNVPRRGSGRFVQGGRHSDERRSKTDIHRRIDRRDDELSEAEKLRIQRFGAGKAL